ncbi:MAG: 6-hydroxycyclohex-1-ene-1-carbonyl-CoA dehydrogenase [Myxococcales bacterium]|nr:6-hydroxycyclohex-1-ene-1-carbonyl-CoA dehydrogenase [Myxococcales bacterium]
MSTVAKAYFLNVAAQPLVPRDLVLSDPGPAEVLIKVSACGLCHTDLGYADGSVAPNHPLPLVLGHEITGVVVNAGEHYTHLDNKPVLVPSVIPCLTCEFCCSGRGNACPNQKMPGNDIHGGFATHMLCPAGALIPLDAAPPGFDLCALSVTADAVSTAYQAIKRSNLLAGDVAFVVGSGGVGGFVIQIANALGAHVVACDVDNDRLGFMKTFGAHHTVLVRDRQPKEVRKELHGIAKDLRVASLKFRIFECSGTPSGQTLAFTLLAKGATLVQVGYTPKPIEIRLSNLMAFDATVHGSWGCPPELYPEILQLIYGGKIQITPFIEHAKLSEINQHLDDMAHHRLARRLVLNPDS